MWVGDVIADRFVIERPLGSGGMGSVFLATDRAGGGSVAVKVLDLVSEGAAERFRRETRILSTLSHPGIVRYVAHGDTDAKQPFLAMELLVGEDLSQRLARGALPVEESLGVVRRAAEALAFAHGMGVVHRDVKPSNLYLVGGDPRCVKVLDFGVARAELQSAALTGTGAMLGTIGYMAPEQASGARDIDARADVFALGCVLHECLTGRPVFAGQHAIAVLAKLLREEPPRLGESIPELAGPLEDLVAHMLAKRPEDRPHDLTEVLGALAELDVSSPQHSRPPLSRAPASLTHSERRIVSVILAEPGEAPAVAETVTPAQQEEELTLVRKRAERAGAELVPLHRGAFLLVFSGRGTASDRAGQAARCALSLRSALPGLRITLATGGAETTGARLPVGPAIDRAASILRSHADRATFEDGIPMDDVTAGLLGPRFEVAQRDGRRVLVGELPDLGSPRLLMGKPTPTVGRNRELAILDATLSECVSDDVASAVLVTAPPGFGKSRLATEFLQRVAARADTRVLVARADPMSAGSSLGLAEQLVLQAIGVHDGLPVRAQAARLRDFVAEHVPPERQNVVAEFLAEILGVPGDREPSPYLRAARNDPAVMQEQKRGAFEALLDAQLERGPLLVVLEDLHWGDTPSVRYLAEALDRHAERPLLVLALARPEVHERFPKLWERAALQPVELGGLSRKSAEQLVREVLGQAASPDLVERIVARASGNAFYLEELIRRVADGDTALPETVLAMAESRLERLEPEARRVLRAASAYGETCWSGAVVALLGESVAAADWLEALAEREVLVRSTTSRFPGEREYAFRHALLRDAAYGMLTDGDRKNAHGLAASWLEGRDDRDAWAIADHLERADEHARAVPWVCRAAHAAIASGDMRAAIALARRGCALGATGPDRGTLLAIEGMALTWGNLPCLSTMRQAAPLLERGTALWWSTIGMPIYEASSAGRPDEAAEFIELAVATDPGDELTGPCAMAINGVSTGLLLMGQVEMAKTFLARFDAMRSRDSGDPLFSAWLDTALSLADFFDAEWQPERGLMLAERVALTMKECAVPLGEAHVHFYIAIYANHLGLYARADAAAAHSIAVARRADTEMIDRYSRGQLALAQLRSGRVSQAIATIASIRDPTTIQAQFSNAYLADAHYRSGDLARAHAAATAAIAGPSPNFGSIGAAVLARVLLAQGEAAECARGSVDFPGAPASAIADLWTSRALALRALGREAEAAETASKARRIILDASERMQDPEIRRSFLTNVDECVRTLATAREFDPTA